MMNISPSSTNNRKKVTHLKKFYQSLLSAGIGVAVPGHAEQAFVGGVASTAFTSVYFATKKLLAELY